MLPKIRTDYTTDIVCRYPSYSESWLLLLALTLNTLSLIKNNELSAIVDTRQEWAVEQVLYMALHRQLGIRSSAYDTCKECEPLFRKLMSTLCGNSQ
jgi:hypothetical protein